MRLEIGKPDYEIEGEVERAEILGTRPNKPIVLVLVKLKELERMHAKTPHIRAVPAFFAIDQKKSVLWLYPTPSAPFWLDLYPPKEGEKAAA